MTAAAKSLSELPAFPVLEFVKLLPAAAKREVLCQLLRDLRAGEPECELVPVETGEGERLGVFLPADTAAAGADAMYASLPAEVRMSLVKPELDFDWNDTLDRAQLERLLTTAANP